MNYAGIQFILLHFSQSKVQGNSGSMDLRVFDIFSNAPLIKCLDVLQSVILRYYIATVKCERFIFFTLQ